MFKDVHDLEPENRKKSIKIFIQKKCAADESFLTRKGQIVMGNKDGLITLINKINSKPAARHQRGFLNNHKFSRYRQSFVLFLKLSRLNSTNGTLRAGQLTITNAKV